MRAASSSSGRYHRDTHRGGEHHRGGKRGDGSKRGAAPSGLTTGSSSVPVFRATLLGNARVGKTSLAAQLTTHNPDRAYYHTDSVRYFYCNGRQLIRSFALRKRDRERIKVNTYGMQIQDTPGELYEDIVEGTAEYELVRNLVVTNPTSKEDAEGDKHGLPERVPLLSAAKKENSNVLVKTLGTMGYIIIFDLSDPATYEKAEALLREIRARIVEKPPILILGNKLDKISETDPEVKHVIKLALKAAKSFSATLYIGTVLGNEFRSADVEDVPERPPLTIQELTHSLAVQIHSKTELWRGAMDVIRRRATKDNENAADDTPGFFQYLFCCACFWRRAATTRPHGNGRKEG